jgi:hypothetical protein
MSNRAVFTSTSGILALGGLFTLLGGCGGPAATPDAGTTADTGTVVMEDAFVPRDSPMRDTNARVDSGVDTFDLQAMAESGFTNAFCACVVARPDSMTTMDECLMTNAGDPAVTACDEIGFRATMGLFDLYAYCRADALDAARDCIAASDCTVDAVNACQDTLGTANTTCAGMLTDPGREAYTPPYTMCIEDMISGPPGECPETLMAVSTTGASVFSGTTDLQGDDTNPDCDDTVGYAPDRGYLWEAPADGTYTIDTFGSDFDTILYVRDECLSATSIACNDDLDPGVMRQSTVDVTLTMGQQVVIIVDGWENEHGNFVVNITPQDSGDAGVVPDAAVDLDAAIDLDAGVGIDTGL